MATPHFKLESPAESLADSFGSPGQQYPSLFENNDSMSPGSYDADSNFGGSVAGDTPAPEQKKPVKKRKSWGQQLPEPKTNLPPRKRAKTEDEKEQRRVERVLRNRRAAQSSRERKRQEVEALEAEKRAIEERNIDLERRLALLSNQDDVSRRNQALEQQLAEMQAKFVLMQKQLEAATGNVVFPAASVPSPAHTEQFRSTPSPVTLSQELFSSRDAPERSSISAPISIPSQPTATVNPASLSPALNPVVDSSNATPSDLTQQPAVSIGSVPALDGFHFNNFSDPSFDYDGFLGAPQPSESDNAFFADGILPPADDFNLDYHHLADDNNLNFNDDFMLAEFLHHDENNQPSPEVQPADPFAESAAFLQPPIGASSSGCDAGGNAVAV